MVVEVNECLNPKGGLNRLRCLGCPAYRPIMPDQSDIIVLKTREVNVGCDVFRGYNPMWRITQYQPKLVVNHVKLG